MQPAAPLALAVTRLDAALTGVQTSQTATLSAVDTLLTGERQGGWRGERKREGHSRRTPAPP
jgi:hypothetical protein